MNVALIGYGKMGQLIHKIAPSYQVNVSVIIDINNKNEITSLKEKNIDVAIEFTTPDSAVNNIIECFKQNIPVVCGTTGWYDKIEYVKQQCRKYNGSLFYGPNFSIGIYIFKRIIESSISFFNKFSEKYNIVLSETHHEQKKDYPSGTALAISDIITSNSKKYKNKYFLFNKTYVENDKITHDTLPIISYRKDNYYGIHEVKFFSENDIITLKHVALNRKSFAEGAIIAAYYIKNNKGLKTFDDLIASI